MSKYDILLAIIAVGFCVWATYTDLRTGKIKKCLLNWFVVCGCDFTVDVALPGENNNQHQPICFYHRWDNRLWKLLVGYPCAGRC